MSILRKIIKKFSGRNTLISCGLCGSAVKEKHAGKLVANTGEGPTEIIMCRECTITMEAIVDIKEGKV